ncbi:hypothetical protein QJQ45_025718 [Haematococcus lacustris]|nr:hypothetical protein QJQ45_025718 [Haematococcus lacustris]
MHDPRTKGCVYEALHHKALCGHACNGEPRATPFPFARDTCVLPMAGAASQSSMAPPESCVFVTGALGEEELDCARATLQRLSCFAIVTGDAVQVSLASLTLGSDKRVRVQMLVRPSSLLSATKEWYSAVSRLTSSSDIDGTHTYSALRALLQRTASGATAAQVPLTTMVVLCSAGAALTNLPRLGQEAAAAKVTLHLVTLGGGAEAHSGSSSGAVKQGAAGQAAPGGAPSEPPPALHTHAIQAGPLAVERCAAMIWQLLPRLSLHPSLPTLQPAQPGSPPSLTLTLQLTAVASSTAPPSPTVGGPEGDTTADELDQATVFGWPLLVHPEPGSSVFTALRQELSDAGQLLLARGPWDICGAAMAQATIVTCWYALAPASCSDTWLLRQLASREQLLAVTDPEGPGGATEAAEALELPTPRHVDLARQLVRDLQAGWQSETKAEGVAEWPLALQLSSGASKAMAELLSCASKVHEVS